MTSISSKQIAMSKKAWNKLSYEAKLAINEWESSGWTEGKLERHVKAFDEVAQEIALSVAPIIEQFPKKIRLYRGLNFESGFDQKYVNKKFLESWTSDRRMAEHFAGFNRYRGKGEGFSSNFYDTTSEKEIRECINNFKKRGYAQFKHLKFMINKKDPEYYNIYDKNNQFVTDGDTEDFEKDIREKAENISERNSSIKSKGKVLDEMIDTSRIIWITNNLDSKEYIVRKK